jgi:tRNA(Ile)-lysidine synthase
LLKTLIFSPELFKRLITFSQKEGLIQPHQTIIIGLSGGPDSVFLLYFLLTLQKKYNLYLIAAHLDHEWRSDSKRDVHFCKTLAQHANMPFFTAKASEIKLSKKFSGSREEEGRLLRRTFFEGIISKIKNENVSIALGHHADDQQETFFIRLLRGTGLTGLTGIKPKDWLYIHPLLCCNKQEIIEALEKNNIDFLVDPTNQSDQFLRNRIRMNVIPALRQCDARFDESLARTMENLREADQFLQQEIEKVFSEITLTKNKQLQLNYKKLLTLHPFLQKQILLHWFIYEKVFFTPSAALFDEILRFLNNSKSKTHTLYQSWKLVKGADQISIEHQSKK